MGYINVIKCDAQKFRCKQIVTEKFVMLYFFIKYIRKSINKRLLFIANYLVLYLDISLLIYTTKYILYI